jgi:hypothetical protein
MEVTVKIFNKKVGILYQDNWELELLKKENVKMILD